MNIETARMLEKHIQGDMPGWKPRATQIGNGEWVVKLANSKIVWSIKDWNENFVSKPVQPVQEQSAEQEMSA